MTDERYKSIMADLGMPNNLSLLQALKQVATESAMEATVAARKNTALDPETVRLAKVAISESKGDPLVCNWMEAAIKVCQAVERKG